MRPARDEGGAWSSTPWILVGGSGRRVGVSKRGMFYCRGI